LKEESNDRIKEYQNAEHKILKIDDLLFNLKNNTDLVLKKQQTSNFDFKKSIIKRIELKNSQVKNEIMQKYDQALENINARIFESIERSTRDLLKINLNTGYLPVVGEKVQSVKNEITFVRFWISYLSKNYEIGLSLEQAVVYHTIFKSLNYIVLDSLTLAKSWIEALGHEENVRQESASPLWVSRLDWLGVATYLESIEKNKIAIISNYNIAIVDAYLLPQLTRWRLSSQSSSQKVFLVSAVANKDKIENKEIFTIASSVPGEEIIRFDLEKNVSNSESISVSKGMVKVSFDAYRKWIITSNNHGLRRAIVEIPKDKFQIVIPDFVFENFICLTSNLEIYFSFIASVDISIEATVKQYVVGYYGEEMFVSYKQSVLGMLEHE
jgi:hypothetical protein